MFVEEGSLFKGMSIDFMNEVGRHLIKESHDAGTFLYRKGEPADYLYVLVDGRIRVILGDQGQIALVVSNPGDALGWSSLVENESHTASAECLVPCRVSKIARDKLAEIFDNDPNSGLQFYKRLTKLFRQQLVDTYRLIPAAHGEKQTTPGF
jgi:CRP-like cAMP-binding protein